MDKRAERRTGVAGADPEHEIALLRAALRVHRLQELPAQIVELTRTARDWSGASSAFAFGPGLDGKGWTVLASSLEEDDPRAAAILAIAPGQHKDLIPDGPEAAEGFGRLAPLFEAWSGAPAHSLLLPVRGAEGSGEGLILLLFDAPPDAETVARLDALMEEARGAVHQARQVATMQQLIIKDDTAHCFNRRYFEEFLPEELARASRFRAPLSLIFLDMDGLKAINTRYGHARGSRSLLEVSLRIRGKIRKFDKLFRFGGDEFCIVLPETEWHGAVEVAERVRDAIETSPFLVRELGGEGVPMTASLGIAAYPLHARNKKDLIQLADRAMQQIKRTTKNGVAVAEILGEEHG